MPKMGMTMETGTVLGDGEGAAVFTTAHGTDNEPLQLVEALQQNFAQDFLSAEGSWRSLVLEYAARVSDDTLGAQKELLDELAQYCDEFLIHAVDVEGKQNGIETTLISLFGEWGKLPITYAGGVSCFKDLEQIKELGKNKLNVTIGSALDLFGGTLKYKEVLEYMGETVL